MPLMYLDNNPPSVEQDHHPLIILSSITLERRMRNTELMLSYYPVFTP